MSSKPLMKLSLSLSLLGAFALLTACEDEPPVRPTRHPSRYPAATPSPYPPPQQPYGPDAGPPPPVSNPPESTPQPTAEIGRASCRERVEIAGQRVAVHTREKGGEQ